MMNFVYWTVRTSCLDFMKIVVRNYSHSITARLQLFTLLFTNVHIYPLDFKIWTVHNIPLDFIYIDGSHSPTGFHGPCGSHHFLGIHTKIGSQSSCGSYSQLLFGFHIGCCSQVIYGFHINTRFAIFSWASSSIWIAW
jgi:hypothetical protein